MSVVISITRRESCPHFSERNNVRAWRKSMKAILKAGTIACGLIAVGCASKMTALNSEMPSAVKGDLEGRYILEKINVGETGIDSSKLRKGILSDQVLQKTLNGAAEDKQSLPVHVSVTSSKREANGGVATVNNIFAFCTLTIWPCVLAEEYEYVVTVETVTGKHTTKFNVLNRDWFGLSPFAIIPVPGWADERGNDDDISAYHLSQVVAGVRESCAELPKDYQTFMKDQANCLEKIDQDRSETAFQQFNATSDASGRVAALSRISNKIIITKHQEDLVVAFKSATSSDVKLGILKLLNDGSIAKLPYDPTLVGYWTKVTDQKILAKVYKDCFVQIPQSDRIKVVARFSDEVILKEMVTPPSEEKVREERNRKEKKSYELREQLRRLNDEAESNERDYKQYRRKYAGEKAKECRMRATVIEKQLKSVENAPVDTGLYVADENARTLLYGKVDPSLLNTIALDVMHSHTLDSWNNGRNGELETAVQIANHVSDKKTGGRIAISLIRKIDAYRSKCQSGWGMSWAEKDKTEAAKLTKAVEGLLSDDLLEEVIKEDDSKLSSLAYLFKDKKRPSVLGFTRIQNAVKGGKENDITKAWKDYGSAVYDDEMLKTLSVSSVYLRRPAFDQIKDEKVKTATLAAIKDALNKELKDCAAKQGELANFIGEIGNGEDLVAWIKGKSGQTELQNMETFAKMKGRMVVLRGEVKNIGQTMFSSKTYVSLRVAKVGMFDNIDVQFNVPDSLKPTVTAWMKGETHIMRGKLTSTGDLEDDAKCEDGEVVTEEKFNEAASLKEVMEDVKWQLKEIEEKKVPPVRTRPSRFGNAVKSAAGWIKSGVDDIKSSGDDLKAAGEMLQGLFN